MQSMRAAEKVQDREGPTRTNFDNSLKIALKRHVHDLLLLIMEAECNYVETPILLYKIANFT